MAGRRLAAAVTFTLENMACGEMNNGKELRLPNFIHVGPTRTGTSWLHEVMKGHIGLPSEKEPRFFDLYYGRGIEWYCNLFGDYPADVPAGEMGPTYFNYAVARERIKCHIPDCKIIVTFREPAARLYSMYRLRRMTNFRDDLVHDTFDEEWHNQIFYSGDLLGYATHFRRWKATFGKSRVLVLFYEDLNSNPQGYLDAVCDFIGARRIVLDNTRVGSEKVYAAPRVARSNAIARRMARVTYWASCHGAGPLIERARRTALWKSGRRLFVESFPPLSEESADEVRAALLPETEELEQIIGKDLSHWKPGAQRRIDDGRTDVRSHAG